MRSCGKKLSICLFFSVIIIFQLTRSFVWANTFETQVGNLRPDLTYQSMVHNTSNSYCELYSALT